MGRGMRSANFLQNRLKLKRSVKRTSPLNVDISTVFIVFQYTYTYIYRYIRLRTFSSKENKYPARSWWYSVMIFASFERIILRITSVPDLENYNSIVLWYKTKSVLRYTPIMTYFHRHFVCIIVDVIYVSEFVQDSSGI